MAPAFIIGGSVLVAAIAEAVRYVAGGGRPRILNVADADAPTTAEIGKAIMAAMNRYAEIVSLPDEPYPPTVGMSPWSVEHPLVLSSHAPAAGTYAQTVPETVRWLIEATRHQDWRRVLPQLAGYPWEQFDYAGEDQRVGS